MAGFVIGYIAASLEGAVKGLLRRARVGLGGR